MGILRGILCVPVALVVAWLCLKVGHLVGVSLPETLLGVKLEGDHWYLGLIVNPIKVWVVPVVFSAALMCVAPGRREALGCLGWMLAGLWWGVAFWEAYESRWMFHIIGLAVVSAGILFGGAAMSREGAKLDAQEAVT